MLKEPPSLSITILIAIPIAIALMFVELFYLQALFPKSLKFLEADNLSIEFIIDIRVVLFVLGIVNSGGACVDIFNIILVGKQVPAKGMVFNNGMKSLYK